MQAKLLRFGEIEIDGQVYDHDVVIEGGQVRKRKKKASKAYRSRYGHTPLSVDEAIPWGGNLIIGTGNYGDLPVMQEVNDEAVRKGVEVIIAKTEEACRLLGELDPSEVFAVLHVTC